MLPRHEFSCEYERLVYDANVNKFTKFFQVVFGIFQWTKLFQTCCGGNWTVVELRIAISFTVVGLILPQIAAKWDHDGIPNSASIFVLEVQAMDAMYSEIILNIFQWTKLFHINNGYSWQIVEGGKVFSFAVLGLFELQITAELNDSSIVNSLLITWHVARSGCH